MLPVQKLLGKKAQAREVRTQPQQIAHALEVWQAAVSEMQ